jgi:molybdopterin-guanine dinucleotide biosynthesis protein A
MGRDKSVVRLGHRTLLGHVRVLASELRLPVRVIRRDLVPRCGPLGGVYTALKTSRADAELFLACDMPFVSARLLRQLVRRSGYPPSPCFVTANSVAAFPFLIPVSALKHIEKQIRRKRWTLQALAKALHARCLALPSRLRSQLLNVNSLEDLQDAQNVLDCSTSANRPKRSGALRGNLPNSRL